ncbi:MAG: radical SAM protein [Elusimicrobia bacterium]|nr:radical SAM protein [Elusimicrobiota bacterium]
MGASGRIIEGTLVYCGGLCSLNCVLCPIRGTKAVVPAPAIKKAIADAARLGAKRVIFVGGEPLLRKDIVELAACARSKGLSVGLATNARMLLYPEPRSALLANGLDSVIVNLFSSDAAGHDALARTEGAFLQAAAAARQLLARRGLTVELRLPLIRGFHPAPAELFLRLAKQKKADLYFTFYYPLPRLSGKAAQERLLAPDAAAELAAQALRAFQRAGLRAYCEGLPLCLMGKDSSAGLGADRLKSLDGQGLTCLDLPAPADYAQPLLCSECSLEQTCPGVFRKAVELFAFDAVKPLKEVRSNSFDYTFDRELKGFRPVRTACPGDSLIKGNAPLRSVYLDRGGKLSLYRTDTRSFSDAELQAVKFSREQLYLDITDKAMLDDFQNDVRQLGMQEVCRDCAKKERCGVCYGVLEGIPFEREERWLRQEIRRLSGRVLDIGCGDLRFYRDTVEKLLAEGKIEYHGLDVDARALAQLKKRHPRARVHDSPIEDFSFQDGYFDYIFALRSLNHFRDLEQAFAAMTALVRDFGIVVIAECVPFGLLRSKEQTRRARRAAGPGFEHYRNWSSEQVLEFIRKKGLPLKLNTHRPVRPGTSNQWLLKLIKIPEE